MESEILRIEKEILSKCSKKEAIGFVGYLIGCHKIEKEVYDVLDC